MAPILALFASTAFLGCRGTLPPPSAPIYRSTPPSTIKSVDWYFDATASMKGFVAPASGPGYSQFVKLLEESLDSLYRPQATFEKHKFGTVIGSFTDLAETFRPSFYNSAKGFEDTDLEVVGEKLNPAGLTIIITDLFQSDDHVETFRAALLAKGLGKTFQFGILAVSTGFNGMLYDIPPLKTSMSYQGLHPLYAIVLGPQRQVREFIKDVVRRGGSELAPGFVQAALLSSDLATPRTPLHDLRVQASGPSYLSLTEVDPAEDGESVFANGTVPPFARTLRLAHSAVSHPTIVYQTELEFDSFEVLPVGADRVEAWKLNSHVHVCSPVSQGSWWSRLRQALPSKADTGKDISASENQQKAPDQLKDPSGMLDPCPINDTELLTEAPRVQIKPLPQNKGILAAISVDLGSRSDAANPLKALEKHTYVVDLKMVPAGEDYVFPPWVKDFSQGVGAPFNGRRTPNLMNFLTNMNQSIAQGNQPSALDDYLYLQSD